MIPHYTFHKCTSYARVKIGLNPIKLCNNIPADVAVPTLYEQVKDMNTLCRQRSVMWSIWGHWAVCYKCVTFHLHRAKTCFIGCFEDEKSHFDSTYTEPGNLTHSCLISADHLDTRVLSSQPKQHLGYICIWGHF